MFRNCSYEGLVNTHELRYRTLAKLHVCCVWHDNLNHLGYKNYVALITFSFKFLTHRLYDFRVKISQSR